MPKSSAPRTIAVAGCIVAVVAVAVATVASGAVGSRSRGRLVRAVPSDVSTVTPTTRARVQAKFAALPLAFEVNEGQTDPQVKYMARGNGYTVYLTQEETIVALTSSSQAGPSQAAGIHSGRKTEQQAEKEERTAAVRMQLIGGNSRAQIAASRELAAQANYFIGNDPGKWHQGIRQYAEVSYYDVYPGVNLAYYGVQKQLEFDFIVSPGANPSPIRFDISGANRITTDDEGNLVLASPAGNVMLHKPVAYQEENGAREVVDARFTLHANNQVGFELGSYDRSRELVIDPSVSYATYLGGTLEDDAFAIATDGSGNAFVTGETKSTNFPTTAGVHSTTNAGGFDVFVTEFDPNGTIVYSTYVGGSGDDSGNAIVVDPSGNAFVAGGTTSSNFPHNGGFQTTYGGGKIDAIVFELASGGATLTFSTFLGGAGDDVANGIAWDSSGIYVVGSTSSSVFPTHNPKQAALIGTSNGFVTKFASAGNSLVYSTYLGGGSSDLATAVAVSGQQAYVTGATQNSGFPTTPNAYQTTCGTAANCNGGLNDAFLTVYNTSGSAYVYSTFLGGSNADQGFGIAVDSSGNAYLTGATASSDFPTKAAVQTTYGGPLDDAFVAELKPTANGAASLIFSTYLGGNGTDVATSIVVDASGRIYVTGATASTNFPVASATHGTSGGGNDAFVSELSNSGVALSFSTYLGGSGNENTFGGVGGGYLGAIAVDSAGSNIYVAGNTTSSDFSTTSPAQGAYGGGVDGFVAKYTQGAASQSFTVTNGALSTTSGAPGVSATSTITVGSVNAFNSAVTLTCSVAPVVTKGPTCGLTGSPVTPPANGTGTAMLSVSTVSASALLNRPAGRSNGLFYATVLPIGGIALLGAGLRSTARRRRLLGFVALGVLLTGLLILPACGGSNSSGGGGGGSGTPPGSYTITVTGAAGGVSVTGAPALTLTVN